MSPLYDGVLPLAFPNQVVKKFTDSMSLKTCNQIETFTFCIIFEWAFDADGRSQLK